jgi:hypothetical protein
MIDNPPAIRKLNEGECAYRTVNCPATVMAKVEAVADKETY